MSGTLSAFSLEIEGLAAKAQESIKAEVRKEVIGEVIAVLQKMIGGKPKILAFTASGEKKKAKKTVPGKIFTEAARGRKQCPNCQKFVAARAEECANCGYNFKTATVAVTAPAPVEATAAPHLKKKAKTAKPAKAKKVAKPAKKAAKPAKKAAKPAKKAAKPAKKAAKPAKKAAKPAKPAKPADVVAATPPADSPADPIAPVVMAHLRKAKKGVSVSDLLTSVCDQLKILPDEASPVIKSVLQSQGHKQEDDTWTLK